MKLAVTGSSMMTSVGMGKKEAVDGMLHGVSGRKHLQSFDRRRYKAQFAYEIADRPGGKDRMLRATDLLIAAVREALGESGADLEKGRACVVVGTGLRELRSLEIHSMRGIPMSIDELHFEHRLADALGADIPVFTLANACAASSFALAVAEDFLCTGVYDFVIVAGCDVITESMFGLLDRVNPVAADRVQPFDRNRKGVLMGDGAAAVVVETLDSAESRCQRILGVVRGVGTSCDARHETAPDVDGICRAVVNAHKRSHTCGEDVDLMMMHGTGTQLNDAIELQSMMHAMPAAMPKIRVSGIKSMTGHTSGASGLVGVVAAIECLHRKWVPPTLGLNTPMPEAEVLQISNFDSMPLVRSRTAQVNAFGFGGVNAVVILESAS